MINVKLTEKQFDLILQSLCHRRLQTGNAQMKVDLQDIETRIDAQIRKQVQ